MDTCVLVFQYVSMFLNMYIYTYIPVYINIYTYIYIHIYLSIIINIQVRKHAAMCIREVSKHTPELAKLIVNSGKYMWI
jgi:hypothetical protein